MTTPCLCLRQRSGGHHRNAWRLAEEGDAKQGLKLLEDLLNRDPTNIPAWIAAAGVLGRYGELPQAEAAYRRVLAIDENHAAARFSLASTLIEQRALADAEPHVDRIVARRPQSAESWACLAMLRQRQVAIRRIGTGHAPGLRTAPNPAYLSHLLQTMQYIEGLSPSELLNAHRQWDAVFAAPVTAQATRNRLVARNDRPLRIGFVSTDFGRHPIGFLVLPLLEVIDKLVPRSPAITIGLPSMITRCVSGPRRISGMSRLPGRTTGLQIRSADEIDVLFDLMGHTGSRLLTLCAAADRCKSRGPAMSARRAWPRWIICSPTVSMCGRAKRATTRKKFCACRATMCATAAYRTMRRTCRHCRACRWPRYLRLLQQWGQAHLRNPRCLGRDSESCAQLHAAAENT